MPTVTAAVCGHTLLCASRAAAELHTETPLKLCAIMALLGTSNTKKSFSKKTYIRVTSRLLHHFFGTFSEKNLHRPCVIHGKSKNHFT